MQNFRFSEFIFNTYFSYNYTEQKESIMNILHKEIYDYPLWKRTPMQDKIPLSKTIIYSYFYN